MWLNLRPKPSASEFCIEAAIDGPEGFGQILGNHPWTGLPGSLAVNPDPGRCCFECRHPLGTQPGDYPGQDVARAGGSKIGWSVIADEGLTIR